MLPDCSVENVPASKTTSEYSFIYLFICFLSFTRYKLYTNYSNQSHESHGKVHLSLITVCRNSKAKTCIIMYIKISANKGAFHLVLSYCQTSVLRRMFISCLARRTCTYFMLPNTLLLRPTSVHGCIRLISMANF